MKIHVLVRKYKLHFYLKNKENMSSKVDTCILEIVGKACQGKLVHLQQNHQCKNE